jgi:hypothetical protein
MQSKTPYRLNVLVHRVITNDVNDCINLLVRIAHIMCNHPTVQKPRLVWSNRCSVLLSAS